MLVEGKKKKNFFVVRIIEFECATQLAFLYGSNRREALHLVSSAANSRNRVLQKF